MFGTNSWRRPGVRPMVGTSSWRRPGVRSMFGTTRGAGWEFVPRLGRTPGTGQGFVPCLERTPGTGREFVPVLEQTPGAGRGVVPCLERTPGAGREFVPCLERTPGAGREFVRFLARKHGAVDLKALQPKLPLHRHTPPAMDRSIPPATEYVWLARADKRARTIAHHKARQVYTCLVRQGLPRPETPDPRDRTISKRAWENRVIRWMLEIDRAILSGLCPCRGPCRGTRDHDQL